MKEAVVAIEDQRFYEHRGVDFQGIARAVYQDVISGSAAAGRLDDHPAVRQERARGAGQPHRLPEAARGGARLPPRAPVVEGQDPHRVPERDLLRRGRVPGSRRPPRPTSATTTPAAARTRTSRPAPPSSCPGRRRCSPGSSPRRAPTRPRNFPENALDAPQPGAQQHGRRRATSPRRSTTTYAAEPIPRPSRDPAAGRELRGALLHLLAAPAARRPLRRRRGLRRRPADQVDARPRAPARGRGRSSAADARRRSGPTASVVVLDNETGGVLRDGRRPRLPEGAVQPGDQRPPPARAPRSSRSPWSPRSSRATRPARCSPPRRSRSRSRSKVPKKNGNGDEGRQRALRGQQLRRLLPRLGLDRDRDHLLRQLGLLAARHPGRARRTSPRPRTTMGDRHRPLDRDRVLDRRRPLRALQPGADPRRPGDRRHPAGDGARLQHARGRRQARSRARWPRAPAARSGSSRSPTAIASTTATRCPTRPAQAARTRSSPSR